VEIYLLTKTVDHLNCLRHYYLDQEIGVVVNNDVTALWQ